MSQARIRQTFETALYDNFSTVYDILPYSTKSTPNPNNITLRPRLLPSTTNTLTLSGDHKVFTGLFQVGVCTPLGMGVGAADEVIEALQALYPTDSEWTHPTDLSFEVQVISPISVLNSEAEDSFFYTPVRFSYRADTN